MSEVVGVCCSDTGSQTLGHKIDTDVKAPDLNQSASTKSITTSCCYVKPGTSIVVDEVSQDLWPSLRPLSQLSVCFLLCNAVQHSSMNCVWPSALL